MENSIYKNEFVLVTCTDWFLAPNGKQYKGVWGKLLDITKVSEILGFETNRAHANWVYKFDGMIIMGCRVMYMTLCKDAPPDNVTEDNIKEGIVTQYTRNSYIYNLK